MESNSDMVFALNNSLIQANELIQTLSRDNLKYIKDAQVLSELKEWLTVKHADKSEHRTVKIGYGLTLEKIKEISNGNVE